MDDSNRSTGKYPGSIAFDDAREEAAAVLEAIGGESHLDGFNLLGVIANPRGSLVLNPSSFHGRYNTSAVAASPSTASNASGSDMLTDTYHTLESTLSHVTEQMEVLNSVLEDWSRQLLEDPYPAYEDHPPESMLKELPQELRNLDLQSLQSYLEACGVVAHAFQQRRLFEDVPGRIERVEALEASEENVASVVIAELEKEIPSRFFQSDFDLTDPDTFRELLLLNESTDETDSPQHKIGLPLSGLNTDGPIHEWFPLPPQDTFGGFLDKVELALLQQVRSKSDAFFEESLRFAQLQEWIQSLLTQVVTMQSVIRQLQQDLLEPMEVVPVSDSHRAVLQDLLNVLELANEMLQCKSSVGGFLSAQDDLAAIEQIQYGRRLLAGQSPGDGRVGVELRRLHALKTVSDHLNQYELLVITNLREELVEAFLEWNATTVSSIYAVNGFSSASRSSQQVQQRVRELVGALRKCRGLTKSREAYGNRLQEVIRMTVRTIVSEFASDAAASGTHAATVSSGATTMSLDRFLDCSDMLFEQLLSMLTSASGVDEFCVEEHFSFQDDDENDIADQSRPLHNVADSSLSSSSRSSPMAAIIMSAAELSSKSVSELLRLRKEAHSLVTLEEMKRIWDKCMSFTSQLEDLSGHKASALRSTLLAQAKAFIERKHESNMSALVAALDSERWTQCEVSVERQAALSRLCSGRAALFLSTSRDDEANPMSQKAPEVEIEGKSYKVVWSCLLMMEMVISDLAAASHFSSLAAGIVAKVAELLRLFNARTTHLVLGAGAIHSTARLKSINAKHLSLVTQCLRLGGSTLPHVRAGLMAQLPPKQHTLLTVFDQIKKEYAEHNEKILNKFVTIIGGIVEHGLAPKIRGTDFDARSKIPAAADGKVACCIFLEGISTNTRKMHQVLSSLLPPDHLQDVFSRIFAFVDQKVPALFIAAAEDRQNNANPANVFSFPKSDEGKTRLLQEVDVMTKNLNGLDGVHPWDFTLATIFSKQMEFKLDSSDADACEKQNGVAKGGDSDNPSHDEDPHPSELVSENGTELTSETLTTADTVPNQDVHDSNDRQSSEAKSTAVDSDAVAPIEASEEPTKPTAVNRDAVTPTEASEEPAKPAAVVGDAVAPSEASEEPDKPTAVDVEAAAPTYGSDEPEESSSVDGDAVAPTKTCDEPEIVDDVNGNEPAATSSSEITSL